MTGLHRTHLTTSQKIQFSSKAVANQATHGAISQLSEQYNISRPTVYQTQKAIQQLLTEHYSKSEAEHLATEVVVDEKQLQRSIIALRVVAPNSIRAIENLLPIIYPGIKLSYGSIQSILSEAEDKAKKFNTQANLSNIKHSALDEMYSQGDPVLAGIDLDFGYLHSLELCQGRTAADWSEVLNQAKSQGLNMEVVVKDAAVGIEAGVTKVFPEAQQRDDCFHVLYDTNKIRRKLRGSAYNAIEYEYTQEKKLGKISTKEKQQRKEQRNRLVKAKIEANKRIEQYDLFVEAHKFIFESMEYVHPETEERYNAEDIEEMMNKAACLLGTIEHAMCKKLAIYIKNRASGIAMAAQALSQKFNALTSHYDSADIDCACLITRLAKQLKKSHSLLFYNRQYQFLLALYAHLTKKMGKKANILVDAVSQLLVNRYRASSAIEGFNAALRPYLYVHKGVTQSFLELFRAYYNLRTRRWGRHKKTSAHECLTGNRVEDWLTLLGYPASQSAPVAVSH